MDERHQSNHSDFYWCPRSTKFYTLDSGLGPANTTSPSDLDPCHCRSITIHQSMMEEDNFHHGRRNNISSARRLHWPCGNSSTPMLDSFSYSRHTIGFSHPHHPHIPLISSHYPRNRPPRPSRIFSQLSPAHRTRQLQMAIKPPISLPNP